ncbi:MAG: precorrin-2 C(20)-methyltransferase [Candidatus Methanomethylophilaceae archaeon]|nr:precorrin-2 C(20)-methyltransferase [Candidatus Methanomethylophilaceae archaeon]
MKGKLFGVSVGPGDWKMMTLRAKEALLDSDIICFPAKAKGSSSFALSIIQQAIDISDKRIEEIVFSMDPKDEVRRESENVAIKRLCQLMDEGHNISLITIGDAGVYSTYMYTDARVRAMGYETEVIPGISSFTYGAAMARLPLMIGDESFCVVPMAKDNVERLEKAIIDNDNIVVMKSFNSMDVIAKILQRNNIPMEKATVMCDVGTESEYIGPIDLKRDYGYFTTVMVKKN